MQFPKKKEEKRTKNYVAKVTVKQGTKDGDYYDFVFGPRKGNGPHIHFGLRAFRDSTTGAIGQEIFYFKDRNMTSDLKMEITDEKESKVLGSASREFNSAVTPRATLQYFTSFDSEKGTMFLESFKIEEIDD